MKPRTWRIFGIVLVLMGIPSAIILWSDQGPWWGALILFMHVSWEPSSRSGYRSW